MRNYKNEVEQPKFNAYDFGNFEWKSKVIAFEAELNNFSGDFSEFCLSKQANKADMVNYQQLLNSLNYLRFLRSRAQKHEAEQMNLEGEIDVNKIAELF